ncbi:MAG: hypothetical protein LBU07_00440 [Coriobacteriales bacterium]|nr:hypothetical protein [Coriobacteriales bacterium]
MDTLPDLVAVEATNGQQGYAYWSDMNDPSSQPANPEEAVALMATRNARDSQLFMQFLSGAIGLDLDVDSDTAQTVYEQAQNFVYPAVPGEPWFADSQIKDDIVNLLPINEVSLPDGEELRTFLSAIFSGIQEENYLEIPVYLEDGVTQIGVFRMGS